MFHSDKAAAGYKTQKSIVNMLNLKSVVLSFFFSCFFLVSYSQQRPNIVFVMSDDHAYQAISAYGFGLNKTPHIDRLAKEGMLFRNAFINNSLCAPSRAAYLTGKYSHLNGIEGNRELVFDGAQQTFPKLLHASGYQTALVGKWHLISDPTGFDYWNILPGQGDYYNPDFIDKNGRKRVPGYVTDLTMDFALNWLDKRDTSRPFCVLIWNKAPHRQWMPPLHYLHQFDNTSFPLPSSFFDTYNTRSRAAHEQKMRVDEWLSPNYDLKENFTVDTPYQRLDQAWKSIFGRLNPEEQRQFIQAYTPGNTAMKKAGLIGKDLAVWKYQRYIKDYLSCVQSVDDNVGRLQSYLSQHGLDKNTIVIYSSDQGFYLGEHGWFDKRFMYEESFKTPLIIKWPAGIKPGRVSNDLVMNIDIAATLLDAAKLKVPADIQGESMLPILQEKKIPGWRKAVYYHYYDAGGEHNVAAHVGVRTDRYKLIWFYENNDWELYDLLKDKEELHNLYNKPQYKQIQAAMKARLKEMEKKYKDTDMLTGKWKNTGPVGAEQ
jgi:arylsulfatase A-like enzyme